MFLKSEAGEKRRGGAVFEVLFESGVVFFLWVWDEGGLERGVGDVDIYTRMGMLLMVLLFCFCLGSRCFAYAVSRMGV